MLISNLNFLKKPLSFVIPCKKSKVLIQQQTLCRQGVKAKTESTAEKLSLTDSPCLCARWFLSLRMKTDVYSKLMLGHYEFAWPFNLHTKASQLTPQIHIATPITDFVC